MGDLPVVHVLQVGEGAQTLDDLAIVEDLVLRHLFLRTDEGALDHVHQGRLVVLVVVLPGDKIFLHLEHKLMGLFVGGKPAEIQRHGAEIVPAHLVEVVQLLFVPGGGEEAVVAVPVVAPFLGHQAGHDVAAGDDVEDIALAPALLQGAVGVVVVVVVLLQVGVVLRAEGHRRGKGVDEDVLPRQSGQLFVEAGGEKVRHRSAPAVAAHPELDKAQFTRLLGCGQIIFQIGEHLVHRDDEAAVGMACAGVQVAHPLAATAAAPQDDGHNGGALAVQGDGLPGQAVAHKVPGLPHVDVVVVEHRVGKAQRRKGVGKVGLPAHLPVGPIPGVAGCRVEGGPHQPQAGQRQTVVVLQRGVGKKAVTIIVVMGHVGQAQLTAEPHGIAAIRHRPAHRALRVFRRRPGHCQRRRRKGQRFTKITSFHGVCFPS